MKHIRSAACLSVLLIGLGAQAQVLPEARKLLSDMVRAYRNLKSVEIETQYFGETGGFLKPVRTRLLARRPNRLRYELWQNTPTVGGVTVRRFVCDGRYLYTYDEAMGQYTRSKAPRDHKGMELTGAGIELAAFAGSDPFATLARDARSVRVVGVDEIDGEPCDVVLIDSGTEDRTAVARLCISKTTRFLRRFAFESVRLKKATPEPPEQPLNPDDPPEQELHEPPVRFHYDSAVTPNPKVPDSAFAWSTPPGALLYEPREQMFDPNRYKDRPSYVIVGKDGKPTKPLTYKELVEMAKKQSRKRR